MYTVDIQVLLSTYNGEKYISDQIESILAQSFETYSLLIRDDGSEDNTLRYLEKYALKYPGKIRFITGSNVGVKKSFFELLRKADSNCSYYSFCDQDDWWLKDKLLRTVSTLNKEDPNIPLLYFTPTFLTDKDLTEIKIWPRCQKARPSFFNALAENIVVGTTATINNKAKDLLLLRKPDFQHMIMHDWWSYICISALGKVIFDEEPSVLYRQHDENLIGGHRNQIDVLRRKWESFSMNKNSRFLYKQALLFMDCYGELLDCYKKRQLELFVAPRDSFISRIRYLHQSALYRNSFFENVLFRFLVLTGYI